MDRRLAFAIVAYVALMGSLATPLYEPLSAGRDDGWAVAVLIAGAHLGIGAAAGRPWVLLLPLGLGIASFVLAGAERLAWLILFFEVPALLAVTALGWLLGRTHGRRATLVAGTAFVVAIVPAAWAASGSAQRDPHVSAREQRALPTMAYSLVQDLCADGASRADRMYADVAKRRARRQFDAIARGLRAHPDALVTVRFVPADAPGTIDRDMTIRDLAETHLEGAELDGPPRDTDCYRNGRVKLERLLDDAG